MTPQDHLKAGDVDAALQALQAQVRAAPGDAKLRIFLFQLYCVFGDWKRAIQQLKVCGEMDPLSIPMTQTYREAIKCEVYREKVFAGEKDALVMGQPQEWLAWLIEAQRLSAKGQGAAAADLRARAFDAAPATSGRFALPEQAPTEFGWIADADMRLGPVLEVIINGRYFWVPFQQIRELEIDAPTDLRDLVWTPATVKLVNEGKVVALIPTRYPGTVPGGSAAERLARVTEWADAGDGLYTGRGLRLFATDGEDIPLFQAGTITLDSPAAPAEA